MFRQVLIHTILFFLISLHFNAKAQDSLEIEKYKVYTDAIYQIQYNNTEKNIKLKSDKDTVRYYPIFLKRKTICKSGGYGFRMYEYIKKKNSISEIKMTNIVDYLIIENNNYVIGLDTIFIKLHYLLDSLSNNNKKLSNNFLFKSKVVFTKKPRNKLFGLFSINIIKFWKRFYEKYPKSFGIFSVSDVFFSNDKKYAILYIGYERSSLGGYGAVYLLKKEKGKWKVIKQRGIWTS